MHKILIEFFGVQITGWKLIGYSGVLLFSTRWFIQMWASRAARKPTLPITFWVMSVAGSLACLTYFVFGKNDSVGVLSNLFPCGVAAYNLSLELAHRRTSASNEQSEANGRQPFSPQTNPTLAPAAPRRSP